MHHVLRSACPPRCLSPTAASPRLLDVRGWSMAPTAAAAAAATAAATTAAAQRAGLSIPVAMERAPPGALACQRDSSLRSLRTAVRSCHARVESATSKGKSKSKSKSKSAPQRFFELELQDTVLFPEGGGQPWDTGRVDDVVVEKVYVQDGRCVHRLAAPSDPESPPPFVEGQEVVAHVDWERRFDHMQQHSAQHLFSAIADAHGYETTTWSLGDERCNVELVPTAATLAALEQQQTCTQDTKPKKNSKEKHVVPEDVLFQIEAETNAAILKGLSMAPSFAQPGTTQWDQIAAKFAPGEMPEAMRVVTIDGLDVNPCCGTHVQNLSQLQALRVLGTEYARGATRVWFVAGNRVNREFSRMLKNEQALTKLLSCAPDEHASRAEKLLQFQKSATKELKSLQRELAASIVADLTAKSAETGVVAYHRVDGDLGFLQTLLGLLGDAKNDSVFVLTAGDAQGEGLFLLAGPVDFISAHGRSVLPLIDGKGGGGKNGILQGKAKGLSKIDTLVAKLKELRLSQ